MKYKTAHELANALLAMPDVPVACYSGNDEGMDFPSLPKLYGSKEEASEAYYTKGDNLDQIMGELVTCEPGTGHKFIPYLGPVVVI